MRDLILKNSLVLATMNDRRDEFSGVDLRITKGRIAAIGPDLSTDDARIVDMSGHVVLPGLVNTHHHFFQTLTRAVPAAQNAELFDWLQVLYPIWRGLTPEMMRISAKTAMAELLLSGCTMASDHLYLFPNGSRLDDTIEAAREIGIRFHATRGSMSVGQSQGGLPPDDLVENEDAILADCERLIARYHDPAPGAMVRMALAPCSPFSVSRELMRQTAEMARRHGVGLHTHLAENDKDVLYSRERFNCTPTQYAEELGWLGPDVWHAHCVKLDRQGIRAFATTRTGVAHCPCSNMRLASGIAPIRAMLDEGVKVALGCDGSASNDANDLLLEARQAMLLQRVGGNPAAMTAREALFAATRGGAEVLGRTDTGYLAPGLAADIACFRVNELASAGALHDPLAALIFAPPRHADMVICHGRVLVEAGRFVELDPAELAVQQNECARKLFDN